MRCAGDFGHIFGKAHIIGVFENISVCQIPRGTANNLTPLISSHLFSCVNKKVQHEVSGT